MRKIDKKVLSFVLIITVFATILSASIPALATEVNLDSYDSHPNFEQLNEAYIEYSIQAEAMGKFVTLPLEHFVIEYKVDENSHAGNLASSNDIDKYLASRISELSKNENIEEVREKQEIMQKAFQEEMQKKGTFEPQSAGGYWFYNCPELPKAGNYTIYPSLLGTAVVSGDLVHDNNGSFGISGHSAIVMGHYYSNIFKEYYVRVCEAVSVGVCYGILSDDRVDSRASSVYRVNGGATYTERIAAANWVASQIGKPWRFVDVNYKTADISKSRPNWYCSLLFYAAYKAQDIDLGDKGGSNALMPRELRDSVNLSKTF